MRLLKNVIMALNEETAHSYSLECLHEFQTTCNQDISISRKRLHYINPKPLLK